MIFIQTTINCNKVGHGNLGSPLIGMHNVLNTTSRQAYFYSQLCSYSTIINKIYIKKLNKLHHHPGEIGRLDERGQLEEYRQMLSPLTL
jgi:hypothetical protein